LKELLHKIKGSFNISEDAERYLLSISKEISSVKGDVLIRQGQSVHQIFYVKSGCLRSYCTDKSGKEHTLQFAINGWWISD